MEFKLAGRQFDLTQEMVRHRLADHAPDPIDQYWVEVDGIRWPVKQVMAVATGLSRTEFQSQNSRRLLAKLGFTVGVGSTPLDGTSPQRSVSRRQRSVVDPVDLPQLETLSVGVTVTWRLAGPIALDGEHLPIFPPLPSQPGLYRYDFGMDDRGVRTVYIGESQDLARRARNYRGAKTDRSTQKTSRRIHTEIVGHVLAGGSLEFAIATEVVIQDGGEADLRLKSARRLAENAAVLMAQQAVGVRVLNIDADLVEPANED